MSQDYSHLYGQPRTPAPPQEPADPPKPFVLNSGDAELPPPKPFVLNSGDAELPPPTPFAMNSADVMRSPAPMPQPQPYRPAPPPKPRQPFSPTSLLLIAGVVFLFLGGALVLKQTWASLADSVRAVILLLFSMMFFGANVVAEKVFRLPKTGLAFYILGCVFLPLSVAGIGTFKLFGEWFSYSGDGSWLVSAVVTACVAVTTCIGTRNYKQFVLAWMSLAATAATVFCLTEFLVHTGDLPDTAAVCLAGLIYIAFNALSLVWTEWRLRTKPDSPYGKAAFWYLYPLMMLSALLILRLAVNYEQASPVIPAILELILCASFFYPRFERGGTHIGVFGMTICLAAVSYFMTRAAAFDEVHNISKFLFIVTAPVPVLLSFRSVPKLPDSLWKTAKLIGMILAVPMLLFFGPAAALNGEVAQLIMLGLMFFISVILFAVRKPAHLHEDAVPCALQAALIIMTAFCGASRSVTIMPLLLVIEAVMLVLQALLSRRLWCFVLAAGAAGSIIALNVPHSTVWLVWLAAALTLGCVIYAHLMRRPFLESCAALCFIPAVLSALFGTLLLKEGMIYPIAFILVLAAMTLLYLLETVAFPAHERVRVTQLYLEIVAGIFAPITLLYCLFAKSDALTNGWFFLLLLLLGVYVVCFVRKRVNLASIPFLVLFYVNARHLITQLTGFQLTAWGIRAPGSMETDTLATLFQIGCNILMLGIFAVMGRLFLKKFYEKDTGVFRLDFPLLTGVLVIISTVATIDWYPLMLFCLFMCVYSLLFLGRLQNRFIPALLASLFGCLTLLCHNIYDPFGLLDMLSVLNIQTLPIMLYLLPEHLFILSLLFILPEKFRSGVHTARFVMYCITMATLLGASMYFKNVTDALVLMGFSFLIMAGSFIPKRLRWFTLGFAVLFVMTIRLTWSFWKSLHWGIYLFLAGILLIAIASIYEYSARYAREHPDQPKKKFQLFATWKW